MPSQRRPPSVGRLLVRLRRLGDDSADIEADLQELFEIRIRERGPRHATWRYFTDAVSLYAYRRCPDVVRAARSSRSGGRMLQDIVFALRLFRRQPWLFAVTLGGLALAIGMSTAVFTLANAVALRGAGIEDPQNVFAVEFGGTMPPTLSTTATRGDWAYSDFTALRPHLQTFDVAAATGAEGEVSGLDVSRATGLAVSGNYFQLLNPRAHAGRTFTPDDDVDGAPPLMVLSYGFWKNRLAADPRIVGQTVRIDGLPFGVIGVADRTFAPVTGRRGDAPPAFWITLQAEAARAAWQREREAQVRRARIDELARKPLLSTDERHTLTTLEAELQAPLRPWNPPIEVYGRTRPGVSRERASEEVRAFAAALVLERSGAAGKDRGTTLTPINDATPGFEAFAVLLAAVGLVVLLAAANLANVLLASAASRAREIGTRLALGATRLRIMRQLLTESLLLGLAAGAIGLVVALGAIPLLTRAIEMPPTVDVSLDASVYGFVAVLAVLVGALAGLTPARHSRRGDFVSALKTDRQGAPGGIRPGRLRWMLVGGQAAASIVLLVVAALLTRSAVYAATVPLGFAPDRLMSVQVGLGRSYDTSRQQAYWDTALSRIRAIPGVTGVALASMPPFNGSSVASEHGFYLARNETTSDYFATVGARLLRGRIYSPEEVRASSPMAVISDSLARRFWGHESPLGDSLERVWGRDDPDDGRARGLLRKPAGTRIIGVVSDAVSTMRNHEALAVYLPLHPSLVAHLTVATSDDAAQFVRPVTEALRSVDSDPGITIRPALASDGLAGELRLPHLLGLLSSIVGVTALWLAVIGLFGVTSFVIGQRRQEVSVRIALGASREAIVTMLLRQALRPVVIGLAIGVLLAVPVGRLLAIVLFGVGPHDPLAMGGAVTLLLATSTAAVLIPARRAARTNPADTLRET